MNFNQSSPIGIFDSGVGGLTVAYAVAIRLPHENIVYFGDTAHAPYGDKSALNIRRHCYPIVDFLLAEQCKVILIACNSATAAAYDDLVNYIQQRCLLMGVIEPVVEYIAKHNHHQQIGLIGTKQTVSSKVFENRILSLPNKLQFKALATPLLVPIIEENFHRHPILIKTALGLYLQQMSNIDALIMGCTHYPLIKDYINEFYEDKLPLLDAGEITAEALAKLLTDHNLLNLQTSPGHTAFYVSDYTPAFAQQANQFFGEAISLQVKLLNQQSV